MICAAMPASKAQPCPFWECRTDTSDPAYYPGAAIVFEEGDGAVEVGFPVGEAVEVPAGDAHYYVFNGEITNCAKEKAAERPP